MIKRLKHFISKDSMTFHYAIDGLLLTAGANLVANNNYLFASQLGASDFQLSLFQFLPQIVNFLVLIPGGIIIDSFRNKKRIVMIMLVVTAALYTLIGLMPIIFKLPLYPIILTLSVSAGMLMFHNLAWQSCFLDVVDVKERNRLLTPRTQMCVLAGMIVPLVSGAILTLIKSGGLKVIMYQSFFMFSALMFILSAYNSRKFVAEKPSEPKQISLTEIKKAGKGIMKNKAFLIFVAVTLFFYMTWQLDWTLYYIGQKQYLQMNEFMIMLGTVGSMAIQLVTMKFWSKKNERYGVVLPTTLGILGLAFCPVAMIAGTCVPLAIAPYAFLCFHFIANIFYATITLNVFQCSLQVISEEYRSLSISVYTCIICLSNAIMPMTGVALYKLLGNDLDALRLTFFIMFFLRLLAALLWFLRWKWMSRSAKDED